jgi:formylglycine-generating enzyme required for sulfatase activity
MHFRQIEGPSLARTTPGTIFKSAQLALLFCGLLGIASELHFPGRTIADAEAAQSNPDEESEGYFAARCQGGWSGLRPAHLMEVQGFWIDEHDMTNAEFGKFVEATGSVTRVERKPVWDE